MDLIGFERLTKLEMTPKLTRALLRRPSHMNAKSCQELNENEKRDKKAKDESRV